MNAKSLPIITTGRTRCSFTLKQPGCSRGLGRAVGGPAMPKRGEGGFTLAELLVSVFVLGIIVFMLTQLMTSATAITRIGHKYIDTDTQARAVFDRMALDFAQMVKRTDMREIVGSKDMREFHFK